MPGLLRDRRDTGVLELRVERLAQAARGIPGYWPAQEPIRVGVQNRRGVIVAGIDWGSVLQSGFQALGQWGTARAQARAPQPVYYPQQQPQYYPQQQYQAPQYVDPYAGGPYTGASWTNAALTLPAGPTQAGAGALVPLAGAAVRVATPALRSAVAFLSRWIAPAAAVEVASELIASGGWPSQAVYSRAGDNKVVGIMRGDIKAIKRVKRMGPRLMKSLRLAGYGRRSLRPVARRRRRA